jgi:hypothetical protein
MYCELNDENIMERHVSVFGSKSFWANRYEQKNDMYIFTEDLKFDFDFFCPEDGDLEITKDEFDGVWRLSQS